MRIEFLAGLVGLMALALSAAAQNVPVANPSFEEGVDAPASWSLSGGSGAWLEEAPHGVRAISVTGSGGGGDSNYWRSGDLALENAATYRLRFRARRIDGSGGSPISGPVFCNRDLWDLASDWQEYTSYFATPKALDPDSAWLRFGQWEVPGTVAFDAIEVARAWPVYRTRGGLTLGEGESVSGKDYQFNAPLGMASANHARPLARLDCYYNAPRLVFGSGNELVYRHEVDACKQTSARVEVNIGHYMGGELSVEVSVDGDAWQELGRLDAVGTRTFEVPVACFPADRIWVRFLAHAKARLGQQSDLGALQIHGYTYHATLDQDAGKLEGKTTFVAVTQDDPRLAVAVQSLGEAIPGGKNVLALHLDLTDPNAPVNVEPVLTVMPNEEQSVRFSGPEAAAAMTGLLEIPYEIPVTGAIVLSLSLGGDSPWCAETILDIPTFYEIGYGRRLPASTAQVGLWWASSGWKINQTRPLPEASGSVLRIRAAQNETEAAQLVLRPAEPLKGLTVTPGALTGPGGAVIPAAQIEVLRVRYVNITRPTDGTGVAAPWPDPLPPIRGPLDLAPGQNQPLWVRVRVPRDIRGGNYTGAIRLTAEGYEAEVPMEVIVFDFTLPDRMTCTTAFGFNPALAFRYHGATQPEEQRAVYDLYLEALSAHHISPYDPAALDPFVVTWPKAEPGQGEPAALKPRIDWTAWDAAMTKAFDQYHFNSFRLPIVGMGGGTFHSRTNPSLLGYGEDTPEYRAAFTAYCRAVQAHLREKGWLDKAFVYWFDEPDPKDYEFVMNGFRKLKEAAPDIRRMLTEQIEPALIGGPNIWCPLTPEFDPEAAAKRRAEGDRFWWYVCTGPKAPYVTLFTDHPGTELRVWLWQTWQRRIDGILIWETNYWTSGAAYPDPEHPQNPYEDPMSWTSGYSTPAGTRLPWGNGDGRFMYPPEAAADGNPETLVLDPPVDSIRFEMLRDGIEDYEYLVMLERLLREKEDRLPAKHVAICGRRLEIPESVTKDLTHFTTDPAPLGRHREAVARAIEKLMQH
jgi:hypothetical protein